MKAAANAFCARSLPSIGTRTGCAQASALLVVLAVALAACRSDEKSSPITTTLPSAPASSAPATTSESAAGGSLVVGTDLPLQGGDAKDTNLAVALLLEQQGGKAGKFAITLKEYDSSSAGQCNTNATGHVANNDEVAVMGTVSSGCTKIELPVLNADPTGPMLMISHFNTNVGITRADGPGEPDMYYPTGIRNYGRIMATEDREGTADAEFAASELQVTKCVVLDDASSYGVVVAHAFQEAAKASGITIVATSQWGKVEGDFVPLFEGFKSLNPDCFFFGGTGDVKGEQLIHDKVAVFGSNTGAVKLLTPDGFAGYPEIQSLAEAEGMYISYMGLPLSELVKPGSAGAKFVDAFKTKFGHDPATAAIYGAAAMQFILKAIEASDGTRKDILRAAFSGIAIPDSDSLVGRELSIDENGDITTGDVSIELLTNGVETFFKTWPV